MKANTLVYIEELKQQARCIIDHTGSISKLRLELNGKIIPNNNYTLNIVEDDKSK